MASKYRNKPTLVDGITFQSRKEGRRYSELTLLEKVGDIKGLKLQPRYDCVINDKLCFFYKADFAYWDAKTKEHVVEDVKGYQTKEFKLKKKVIEALHGFTIRLI